MCVIYIYLFLVSSTPIISFGRVYLGSSRIDPVGEVRYCAIDGPPRVSLPGYPASCDERIATGVGPVQPPAGLENLERFADDCRLINVYRVRADKHGPVFPDHD